MTTENIKKDFAVIATGGKQYIVSAGDVLDVELLGDFKAGDAVEFNQVLMQYDKVGTPTVPGAVVKATYVEFKKGIKLSIIRFKAKSNRDRKLGHRQKYSRVRIESVA
jgi:large subunit ribosomal protein L21